MKWRYEVSVGTIGGEVEAPNEDAAMQAAGEDAYSQAHDAIDSGTWGLWHSDDLAAGETGAEGS